MTHGYHLLSRTNLNPPINQVVTDIPVTYEAVSAGEKQGVKTGLKPFQNVRNPTENTGGLRNVALLRCLFQDRFSPLLASQVYSRDGEREHSCLHDQQLSDGERHPAVGPGTTTSCTFLINLGGKDIPLCADIPPRSDGRKVEPLCSHHRYIGEYMGIVPCSIQSFIRSS